MTKRAWHIRCSAQGWPGATGRFFAAGLQFQFVSSLNATVVHSDEGTSFYLFSGLGP